MILKYSYWFFKQVIPNNICDLIIKDALSRKIKKGTVGSKDAAPNTTVEKLNIRNSDVVFINDPWLRHLIHPYIHQANRLAEWNFQLTQSEAPQFTIYKKNQFYNWHADGFPDPNKNGLIRKLSMTLSLSDPSEYKGGEFEFNIDTDEGRKNIVCTEVKEKGSIVVFPSHVKHKINPITKGTRYSLVLWYQGDPFV